MYTDTDLRPSIMYSPSIYGIKGQNGDFPADVHERDL